MVSNKLDKKTVLIVAGPTASGKSSFALDIAKSSDSVIINADSMQVYNGLHMLTAHPSCEEQAEVPHHLYGVLPAWGVCSAAKWCDMAFKCVTAAHDAGQLPIVTGGTGFYLKSMMEGLSPIPDVSDDIRQETIRMCKDLGREVFAEKLALRDHLIAKRIDMRNPQRMMRAWEVLEMTGKSLAYWQDLPREGVPENISFVTVVLLPDREVLYRRCDRRFEWMVDNGVMDEVTEFMTRIDAGEVKKDALLTQALGFHELANYILGHDDKEGAIKKAQQTTRRYAKRQSTWFRNQMPQAEQICTVTDNDDVRKLLSRLQG